MNAIDLPSSVYQTGEQDYSFWPEDALPSAQLEAATEQQDLNSYFSFPDDLDFSSYNESHLMSDFSDAVAAWDEQTMPNAHYVTGMRSTEEETRR
jgi:hypothetical protein